MTSPNLLGDVMSPISRLWPSFKSSRLVELKTAFNKGQTRKQILRKSGLHYWLLAQNLIFLFVSGKLSPTTLLSNIYTTLDIAVGVTSIYTMTGISLERFIAVKFPLKRKLQMKKACVFLIPTWLVGIIVSAARFGVRNMTSRRIYALVVFTLVYVIPLMIIASAYIIVWSTLTRKKAISKSSQSTTLSATVNRTIVITIICFIVCWTPFMVLNVVIVFQYPIPPWIGFVVKGIHYTNSIVNFFVYATKIHEFRLAVKSLVCCIQ